VYSLFGEAVLYFEFLTTGYDSSVFGMDMKADGLKIIYLNRREEVLEFGWENLDTDEIMDLDFAPDKFTEVTFTAQKSSQPYSRKTKQMMSPDFY